MSENDGVISENEINPLKIEGHLDAHVNITEIYPIKKPSPHITIDDMDEIKTIIEESKGQYEGYVITHGTDTLEETAFSRSYFEYGTARHHYRGHAVIQ